MADQESHLKGPRITPRPVRPGMSVSDMIRQTYLAYNGARMREASRLLAARLSQSRSLRRRGRFLMESQPALWGIRFFVAPLESARKKVTHPPWPAAQCMVEKAFAHSGKAGKQYEES